MHKPKRNSRLAEFKAPESVDDIGSSNTRSGVRQVTSSMFKMGQSPTSSPFTTPTKRRMPRSEFLSAADRQRSLPDLSPKVVSVRGDSEGCTTPFPELRSSRRSTSLDVNSPDVQHDNAEVSCCADPDEKAGQNRITVCVRVRPLSTKEAESSTICVRTDGKSCVINFLPFSEMGFKEARRSRIFASYSSMIPGFFGHV